jgi:hypothetical protein
LFHGVARNARTYRDYAQALADRHCCCWSRRLFDQRDFPHWRYQRGGIVKDGGSRTRGLDRHAGARSGRLGPPAGGRPLAYSLLGHSAGRQFLERLAAFVPTQAAHRRRQSRKLCVSQPGGRAPYGLGKVYAGADGERNCGAISNNRSPSILAKGDTHVDDRDDSPEARAQGGSRHERGVNVFKCGTNAGAGARLDLQLATGRIAGCRT